jgi:predicted nuclease with TOPRIM domain
MTDEMNTSPTMETLLARMNEWGASITGELVEIKTGYAELRQSVAELRRGQDELRNGQDELRKGQDELRKGQDELRADMNEALYRVKRQIQNLNDTILEVRGDFRQLAILFEKLEAEFPPTK